MIRHNKGPWTADPYGSYIKCGQRKFVCQFFTVNNSFGNARANQKRIVECVNAMEGIDDPQKFRSTWEAIKHLELDKAQSLKNERDHIRQQLSDVCTLLMKANLFIESLNPNDTTIMEEIDEVLSKYNP